MSKQTHADRLLTYFKEYGKITSLQAIQDLGNTRISATIHTLRKKHGYAIYTDMIEVPNRFGDTTQVAQYTIEKNPITGELVKFNL
jgi:hypothetical protein